LTVGDSIASIWMLLRSTSDRIGFEQYLSHNVPITALNGAFAYTVFRFTISDDCPIQAKLRVATNHRLVAGPIATRHLTPALGWGDNCGQ
jgi:hypothetical protein